MKRLIWLVVILYLINIRLPAASIQLTQYLPAFQTVLDSRVLFEQLRERLIQATQKSKSFDLNSLQMILDYYGIPKEHIKSKNEAIELILRSYQDRQTIISSSHVLVLKSESPKTISSIPKFDFRVLNEAAGLTFLANAPKGPENYAFSYNGQNFAIGLDLKPISSVVTPYERIMQYEARRSWAQFCIEHDMGLYLEYKAQRARCTELIKRMLDYSTNPDALGAQLSVNSLYLLDVYDEGAVLCDWVKPGIQNLLFKDGNFVGIDSREKLGKLLKICHPFFKEVLSTKEYIELLQEYKAKNIPGADILLKRVLGTNGYWDAIKCLVSDCFSSFPQTLDAEIAHSRMVQNSIKVLELCKNEKFDEARKIVTALRVCPSPEVARQRINEAHYLSLLVENEYSTIFNSYGIRYTDTADPYYIVAKGVLDSCPYPQRPQLQEIFQETISNRRNALSELLKYASTIQKESPFIKAVGYKILDAQNDNEIVDILCHFSKDYADDNVRNAYSVFISKGIPRAVPVNECAQNVDMPASLELAAGEDIRKWYGYCASFKIESDAQKELITCALGHLKQACGDNENRAQHLYMAQRFYEDATGTHEEKLFLKLSTLAHQFDRPVQNQLHNELLRKLCERLQSAQDEVETLTAIEMAQDACEAIQTRKVKTMQELETLWAPRQEPAVLSGTSEIYSETELEIAEEEEFKAPYGCGNSLFEEIGRRFLDFPEALFEWEEPYGGVCFPGNERAKNLHDPESQEIEEVIDIDRIPQCNGGQQTLPSFGEPAEETDKETESEAEKKSETEDEKQIERIKEKLKEVSELSVEETIILEEFFNKLKGLVASVGIDNIQEAVEIEGLNAKKIIKMPHLIEILKFVSQALMKINSNAAYKLFKYDAAHNGEVDKNSIEEALAGIAAIEQKFFETLKRSSHDAEEFLDQYGVAWDVKTAKSYSWDGKAIFNVDKFIDAIKKEFRGKENVILQITDLNESDLKVLYRELQKRLLPNEISRILVIHVNDPAMSMSSDALKQFLEKYVDSN